MGVLRLAGLPGQRNGRADLDAPDLPAVGLSPEAKKNPSRPEQGPGEFDHPAIELNSRQPEQTSNGRARGERAKSPSLPPDASENLRNELIAELEQLVNSEALATWAHRALPLKNQLATADAQALFAARLSQIEKSGPLPPIEKPKRLPPLQTGPGHQAVTVISKPVRERDREHLRFVAAQPCLVCGRTPSDAHHIRFGEQGAMGRKVSDRFTVPICRLHHRELHRRGNERVWWQNQKIEPLTVAATLRAEPHITVSIDVLFG
jgi:hypothetical protein